MAAKLQKPTFQQGAPLDIGELNKLYDNTVIAYQQGAVLMNATASGQSQSFITVGYSGTADLPKLDTSGKNSVTVNFGNVFNFGINPIVVATISGDLSSDIQYAVSVTGITSNSATIYVYGGTKAANKTPKVNYIAMAQKPIATTT